MNAKDTSDFVVCMYVLVVSVIVEIMPIIIVICLFPMLPYCSACQGCKPQEGNIIETQKLITVGHFVSSQTRMSDVLKVVQMWNSASYLVLNPFLCLFYV